MPPLPPRPNKPKPAGLPAEDANLLQEIDDTLRAERMAQIWKDFGGIIVGASVAILLATVGWVIWKNHMEAVNLESTSQMIQAQTLESQGKYSDAAELYARIGQSNKNKRSLAALYQADAWVSAGQAEKAKAALAGTGSADAFTELARLKLGAMLADTGDTKALDEAAATDKPFSYTAREIQAQHLLGAGKKAEALAILKTLSLDPQVPFSLKQRVSKMIAAEGGAVTPVAPDATK